MTESRIDYPSWKRSSLSKTGKLTLIKSVLLSIPIYILSLFIALPKVVKEIEKVIRDFLWDASDTKKGYHYVKWKTCCLPLKTGGLGIKSVRSMNKALLSKWWWRFNHEKIALWRNGIVSKYESTQQDRETKKPKQQNNYGVWKGIYSLLNTFKQCTILKVGDGNSIRFWEDHWVGEHPLNVTFPNIYRISSAKNWTIRKCAETLVNGGSWNLGLDRSLNQAQIDEAIALSVIIEQCRMDGNHDDVSWAIDKNETFSVKSSYSWVEKEHQLEDKNPSVWSILWPHKIGVFLWQDFHEKLPTMDILYKKGKLLVNGCLFCLNMESRLHISSSNALLLPFCFQNMAVLLILHKKRLGYAELYRLHHQRMA